MGNLVRPCLIRETESKGEEEDDEGEEEKKGGEGKENKSNQSKIKQKANSAGDVPQPSLCTIFSTAKNKKMFRTKS